KLQLLGEHVEVDDDAVADDRRGVRVEDPRGQQVEDELLTVHDQGVSGVIAAGVADAEVDAVPQLVGRLALAFVPPLGTDHDNAWHCSHLHDMDEAPAVGRGLTRAVYRTAPS